MPRKFPRKIRRLVVKVGSSIIATYTMRPRTARLKSLVEQISQLSQEGTEVILVSSGAIVLGMGEMGLRHRPGDLSSLQALAAIGQTVLMRTYSELFRKNGAKCAQVLLTWDDFDARQRYNSARQTLSAILDRGVIPIINENDTIATDEIKFGDNDKLSSFVSSLVHADLLILLSDVEGLYNIQDKEKIVFDEIKEITKEVQGYAGDTCRKHVSRGGMSAKLEAVKIASHAKIPCVIAHGETPDVLPRILKGERLGTLFLEKEEKLLARKHWISFGAKPKGVLFVDAGAKKAVLENRKSLLLPGIVKWEGHFNVDDVVVIRDENREEIARGIVNYATSDLQRIWASAADQKRGRREVVHCDNLVPCKR